MDQPTLKLRFEPTIKQHDAWTYLHDARTIETLFGGGAGGAKSFLGCAWLILCCIRYPGTRWLLGRAVLKTLKQSTLLTLFEVLTHFGVTKDLYHYNQQDGIISFWTGSQIYLFDLAYYPSDPNYDRIGSTEFTGAFIDEANQVTHKAKEVVRSRCRYKLREYDLIPKVLMSCNPAKNWVYTEFYKPWKEGTLPHDRAFVQALVTDNPHISPYYVDALRQLRDKTLRERLFFGNWEYDDDPAALFAYDAIMDLFSNTIDEARERYITADVARFGDDRTVIMVWQGLKLIRIKVLTKTATTETEQAIMAVAEQEHVPLSRILVDEDGVGGGIVDHLKCKGFVGGSSPIRDAQAEDKSGYKVNYLNLRAQCYYTLSEYTQERRLAIQTDNEEYRQLIAEELEQIKGRDVERDGKLKVIAKDEIKEHLGRSPDFADALMMRCLFELDKTPTPAIRWL